VLATPNQVRRYVAAKQRQLVRSMARQQTPHLSGYDIHDLARHHLIWKERWLSIVVRVICQIGQEELKWLGAKLVQAYHPRMSCRYCRSNAVQDWSSGCLQVQLFLTGARSLFQGCRRWAVYSDTARFSSLPGSFSSPTPTDTNSWVKNPN